MPPKGIHHGAMTGGKGLPEFGAHCVFCGTEAISTRRESEVVDRCLPLMFLCPECGAYRICEEFDDFLWEKAARRVGVRKFVTEAALEGFLPRLCINHQDFEEIASPFLRAWQKCSGCRNARPWRTLDGRLVHGAGAEASCRAHEEWRELDLPRGEVRG